MATGRAIYSFNLFAMNRKNRAKLYRAVLTQQIQNDEELERILKEQSRTMRNKLLFLFYYEKTVGCVAKACRLAQIKSTRTVYNWKKSDPEFANAMKDTITYTHDVLNDHAKLLAFSGNGIMIRWLLNRLHPQYMNSRRLKAAKRAGLIHGELHERVQFQTDLSGAKSAKRVI